MAWRVEFTATAEKSLDRLDRKQALRILDFMHERLARRDNPRSLGEPLKGQKFANLWKYRVGDFRVICAIEDDVLRVLVVRIGHRLEIYR